MTSAQTLIVATIVIYLGAMLLIGLYFNRKGAGASSSDFFIGGRSLGAGSLRTPPGHGCLRDMDGPAGLRSQQFRDRGLPHRYAGERR